MWGAKKKWIGWIKKNEQPREAKQRPKQTQPTPNRRDRGEQGARRKDHEHDDAERNPPARKNQRKGKNPAKGTQTFVARFF